MESVQNQIAVFTATGAERLERPAYTALLIAATTASGYLVAKGGLAAATGFIFLPFLIFYLVKLFKCPAIGLITILVWSFLGIGLKRYTFALFGGGKLGLAIDALLLLTFIALLLNNFYQLNWKPLKNGITVVVFIWFLYNVLQIFNPETASTTAWFFAVRGVALYMLAMIPLTLLLFNKRKYLDLFIWLWLALSFFGLLWGLKQQLIELDFAEKIWIADPRNSSTHLLHGKLRVFSFYTDAGQFGAAQGHAGIAALILALGPGKWFKKIGYGIVGLLCIWGLMISGTRGALIVPFIGAVVYLCLSKNWKLLISGVILLIFVYSFFRFTYIGQGVYAIGRMRDAIHQGADVPSLQARIRNQKLLSAYLENKPFGGGVGSAGYWGMRFNPDSFLAQTPTDSWYVRIWAEEGIIGLYLHIGMLLYILVVGGQNVLRIRDPDLRQKTL